MQEDIFSDKPFIMLVDTYMTWNEKNISWLSFILFLWIECIYQDHETEKPNTGTLLNPEKVFSRLYSEHSDWYSTG